MRVIPCNIPRNIRALLKALQFRAAETSDLAALTPRDWREVLSFCDRTQLALALLQRCREQLPGEILKRLEGNLAANRARHTILEATYRRTASALHSAHLPVLVLKGFTQSPWFVQSPAERMQYDLDFYFRPEHVLQANVCLTRIGYEPLNGYERFPTDHLPTLVRRTGWQWRGDYFDAQIPLSIDLHFRFWDRETERFEPGGLEQFWQRRVREDFGGIQGLALHPADRVGYTCLHLLRHILRGSARPYHVYELAWLLHHRADDGAFWSTWSDSHGDSLKRLEYICFDLSRRWFDCRIHEPVEKGIAGLPAGIRGWLDHYALAPLEGLFAPNKHELWLHMTLLESGKDRRTVLRRRLLPATLPGPVDAVLVPKERMTIWIRIRRQWRYAFFLAGRLLHHARALPSTFGHGALWAARNAGLEAAYFRFLSAAWLYELGMFVFVLLYNLRLLELGYQENYLGLVTSAQTAGSLAGVLPAGLLVQRWGIGRLLCGALISLSATCVARSVLTDRTHLLVAAFAGGFVASAFMVAFAPAIARLTHRQSRPLGYSVFFSSGVAMGILGGVLGGRLPEWLSGLGLPGKQGALLASSALIAVAALPVLRLDLPSAHAGKRVYPRDAVVWRFLAAIAVWQLAIGAFNPFFNAYFSHHLHAGLGRIGALFSISQFAQVVAMLAAPWLLRRLGLVAGIVCMQLATALALGGLAASSTAPVAAAVYVACMASQWMSEPGMYSVLMNPLKSWQMGGAAALNMMVTLLAQLVAAAAAGAAISRFGYRAALFSAAVAAALAGLLFWVLLRDTVSSMKPST